MSISHHTSSCRRFSVGAAKIKILVLTNSFEPKNKLDVNKKIAKMYVNCINENYFCIFAR